MIRQHPGSTLTAPLFPYTTFFRSADDVGRRFTFGITAFVFADLLQALDAEGLDLLPDRLFDVAPQHGGPAGAVDPGFELGGGHVQQARQGLRSEEHKSELQSLMRISYAVFCLKQKKKRVRDT